MRVQKKALLAFIREHEYVTFDEIEQFFYKMRYNFKGDTAILLKQSGKVAWNGWNAKTSNAFMELVRGGKIELCYAGEVCAPAPPIFEKHCVESAAGCTYLKIVIKAR